MQQDGLWVFKTWWWAVLKLLGFLGIGLTLIVLFVYDILLSYGVIPFNHPLEGVVTWIGGVTMGIWALMFFLFIIIDLIASRE